ncbi:hypothetical protein CcCBS67573_g04655 [Chytriomyces confervae]|uniref:Uncharacterized protein n=1 Tax=Chytriomyces confervae TaxID=246404 RepID=A0A507FER7_9FUNG|nr:hypothetical protein HDU80_008001 [Chytriomyces hyalinus]TPX74070.1 hypothetical protein CcCBS67573_g04655 [Chytriomyces confervae]
MGRGKNRILSEELVSVSVLDASSTDESGNCFGGHCAVTNVKQTAPNDATDHLTNWASAPDANCAPVWVSADWKNMGPYTVSSLSVLYTPHDGGARTDNVVLIHKDGSIIDISKYLLCTPANVQDGSNRVRWDICALDSLAPVGTYQNIVGAKWTFTPTRPSTAQSSPSPVSSAQPVQPTATNGRLPSPSPASLSSLIPSTSSTTSLAPETSTSANATLRRRDDGPVQPRCQIGIYELQIHGVAMPKVGIPVGAVIGIIVGIAVFVLLLIVCCCLRKASTRKNIANWLMQPSGGWQRLELWKDGEEN